MRTLAPGLLVATPSLLDPHFARTVVLLVEHGESGSLGFVINRPSRLTPKELADAIGVDDSTDGLPVYTGGPVAPQSGWLLFDPREIDDEEAMQDALRITDTLAVSASRRLLERLLERGAPARCLLALGYAGWGEGQLDEELAEGAWLPMGLEPDLVFDASPGERWARVLSNAGIDPGRIVSSGGGVS